MYVVDGYAIVIEGSIESYCSTAIQAMSWLKVEPSAQVIPAIILLDNDGNEWDGIEGFIAETN